MLLTKKVKIRINNKNIKHLSGLGYTDLIINREIEIPIEHLMLGSKAIVVVSCDICKKEKEMEYKLYNYCISKHNIYTCSGVCTNIKRSKTSLELFGVDHWMKSKENFEKYKSILLDKTGYDNPFKPESAKAKQKNTLLKKYGVDCISHSPEIYMRQQISGFSMKLHEETGLYYRGSYELDFINICYQNGVNIQQGKRFEYFDNGKKRLYFSDFFYPVKNLVIEIKSDYYYRKYLDTNNLKKESVIQSGYEYILILNKNYDEFNSILKH